MGGREMADLSGVHPALGHQQFSVGASSYAVMEEGLVRPMVTSAICRAIHSPGAIPGVIIDWSRKTISGDRSIRIFMPFDQKTIYALKERKPGVPFAPNWKTIYVATQIDKSAISHWKQLTKKYAERKRAFFESLFDE